MAWWRAGDDSGRIGSTADTDGGSPGAAGGATRSVTRLLRSAAGGRAITAGRTPELSPCTLRRSGHPAAHPFERLGPGRSAAPDEDRLVLLPSGPDTVHESPLRGTRSSTSRDWRLTRTGTSGGDSALLERIAGTGHR